jgi:ADP-ribose pyrophosphatase YjhB (NUDIX family)
MVKRAIKELNFRLSLKLIQMSREMAVAADVIVRYKGKILLVKRGIEPYKGRFCFPGGGHEKWERIEETAKREVKEETGLDVELKEILGVYSDPERDPRAHTLSVVFIADSNTDKARAGDDAVDLKWIEPGKINIDELAFDHGKILKHYLQWLEKRGTFWSSKD